jgi:hypothetical protein
MTIDDARRLIEQKLDEMSRHTGQDLVTADEWTADQGWCWVFGYNTRAFLETRLTSQALVGNGPFVVEKASGQVHRLVSGRPVEAQLDELRPGSEPSSPPSSAP